MDLNKKQTEWYAAEIYKHIYKYKDFKLVDFESPDFILWKKHGSKIGIEVTRPSDQQQNERLNIANTDKDERDVLGKKYNYDKHKAEGAVISGAVYIELSSPTFDGHDTIANGIVKKFEKLKGYTIFDRNVLCCLPLCLHLRYEEDHNYILNKINQQTADFSRKFDEIILFYYSESVHRYSLNSDNTYYHFDSREIDDKLHHDLQLEASQTYI